MQTSLIFKQKLLNDNSHKISRN